MTTEKTTEVAEEMPDDLGSIKALALEYVNRSQAIDDEIEALKEDKKELKEEFKKKLDIKTLEKAIKILKLTAEVEHKDAYDAFMEVLTDASKS